MITCNRCPRTAVGDETRTWMMDTAPDRATIYTCPACLSPDEYAAAVYATETLGFVYDPVTGQTFSRPRDRELELTRFHCPCGWVLVDSGEDVPVIIAEHQASCPA